MNTLLEFHSGGIVCPAADVAVDPVRAADVAVITHAHADHARRGSRHYLAHRLTAAVLRRRLGAHAGITAVEYGEVLHRNGVRISLHPAGHVPGAAQVRFEYRGEVAVVSGDYKPDADGLAEPFEPLRCHHFVTESTFGLPVFRFPPAHVVAGEINSWWRRNSEDGRASVLVAYPLGKAQRLAALLDRSLGPVFLGPAAHAMHETLRQAGVPLPELPILPEGLEPAPGSMLITSRAGAYAATAAAASGWMLVRRLRAGTGTDRGFVLSDHADWDGLNAAVEATGAERVSVVHGYAEAFARWLRECRGVEAHAPLH